MKPAKPTMPPRTKPRRSRRRVLIRSAAYTLSGFVVATLIAWTAIILHSSRLTQFAHTEVTDPSLQDHPRVDGPIGVLSETLGITNAMLTEPDAHGNRLLMTLFLDDSTAHRAPVEVNRLPSWVRREPPTPTDAVRWRAVTTQAAGFPFRMIATVTAGYEYRSVSRAAPPEAFHTNMSCPVRHEKAQRSSGFAPASRTVTWGGMQAGAANNRLAQWTNNRLKLPDHLPLTPYWPGLLANTAIYTAIIWFLCWTLATTRRTIHRWRNPNANPCKHCHYDLTGITQPICPECGQPIPSTQSNPKSERQPRPKQTNNQNFRSAPESPNKN